MCIKQTQRDTSLLRHSRGEAKGLFPERLFLLAANLVGTLAAEHNKDDAGQSEYEANAENDVIHVGILKEAREKRNSQNCDCNNQEENTSVQFQSSHNFISTLLLVLPFGVEF